VLRLPQVAGIVSEPGLCVVGVRGKATVSLGWCLAFWARAEPVAAPDPACCVGSGSSPVVPSGLGCPRPGR
jgi:hypothetical protein